MAQSTPNVDNPTTPEDFKALKELRGAQADALDAQTRLLNSQKALQKAQAADDPAVAQLAAATQAANIAAQQKALSESVAAIRKNEFTVPESGYTGDIKPGDKAGSVETALLAARAVNLVAGTLAKQIKVNQGESVVLFGGSDLPDFQSLIGFRAQQKGLSQTLDDALSKIDGAQANAQSLLGPRPEFVSPAMIGAGLDAANKILGYFRTDYAIQGVTLTTDDLLLVNALAGALTKKGAKVAVPALYNAPAVIEDSSVIDDLNVLANKRVALQQRVDLATSTVEKLTALLAKESDTTKKDKITAASSALKTAADQGKVTVALYDAFLTKLTTPDDKAKVPLTAVVQQQAVRSKLANGAKLLAVKTSTAGGTYYTRKNLWSFFGTMPFFVMGGVVINYNLLDGKTGDVLDAGAIPFDGGFFKVHELTTEINKTE